MFSVWFMNFWIISRKMSSAVQQQNRVFAALYRNYFINILRGDIRIKYWSNARRAGWVACSATRNLSTNSVFALGLRKTVVKDFEFAGRRTFRLRGPCWTVFSGAPCNAFNFCRTQLFAFMSIRPLSGWDSTAREISEPFHVPSHSREKDSFFPSVCLSVRPHVPALVPLDGILWN